MREFEEIMADATDTQKEIVEVLVERLSALREAYSHLDIELRYDIENLIAECEEYC